MADIGYRYEKLKVIAFIRVNKNNRYRRKEMKTRLTKVLVGAVGEPKSVGGPQGFLSLAVYIQGTKVCRKL